ncbi:MAG TPA: hypothetical protein V6D47_20990, partial [Oscillatoriaceae cyanobacterium]
MRDGAPYLSMALLSALMLAACEVRVPQATPGVGVQRLDTHATATCPVAPTPIPPPWPHDDVVLDSIEGVPGFAIRSDGTGGTPRVARLKVKAYPGSSQIRIVAAHIKYVWPADGATRAVDVGLLPVSPVYVPRAPQDSRYGAPAEVDVPLPPLPLEHALAGAALPKNVFALVTFVEDDAGETVTDENSATLTARVEVPTRLNEGPDLKGTPACGNLPEPVIRPVYEYTQLAELAAFLPSAGITVSASGAAATSTVKITLH